MLTESHTVRTAGHRLHRHHRRYDHNTAAAQRFGRLPLVFEPNVGQTDRRVAYLAHGRGFTFFLTRNGEAVLALPNVRRRAHRRALPKVVSSSILRMRFVGSSAPWLGTRSPLAGRANYLIGNDPATYGYNDEGERTEGDSLASPDLQRSYGWDRAGRLRSFHSVLTPGLPGTPVDTTKAYSYDGDGLLSSLTWSHAEGSLPVPVSDGTYLYVNGPDGLPIEQVQPTTGNAVFYHRDALGSTRALTSSFNTVLATYDYDPYGRPLGTPPTGIVNPFGFAGQYTDSKSGLVYMRQRWYDPETGQFMSRDPLGFAGGDQNLYGYAGRDPVGETDPTGLLGWDDVANAIGSLDNPVSDVIANGTRAVVSWGAAAATDFAGVVNGVADEASGFVRTHWQALVTAGVCIAGAEAVCAGAVLATYAATTYGNIRDYADGKISYGQLLGRQTFDATLTGIGIAPAAILWSKSAQEALANAPNWVRIQINASLAAFDTSLRLIEKRLACGIGVAL